MSAPSCLTKPNLFIVGAPKAGTSSIHYYLAQHPEIFMSEPKEPWYFAADIAPGVPHLSTEDYFSLFSPAGDFRVRGEAAVWNLYSEVAAQRILRACGPSAKIIIVLRKPSEYVRSMFQYNQAWLIESADGLEEALALEESRHMGCNIPRRCVIPERLHYLSASRYVEQVKRYVDTFPRANICVTAFENLFLDLDEGIKTVYRFLGVSDHAIQHRQKRNRTYGYRSRKLRALLVDKPERFEQFFRRSIPSSAARRFWYRAVRKLNARKPSRVQISAEVAAKLNQHTVDQIAPLESLTGSDFSCWQPR